MSDPSPTNTVARPTTDQSVGAPVGLLLACFEGAKNASKIRKTLNGQIHASGGVVLDEVILRVDSKGKALVYDPRRTVAGTLTPALTWGIFGLLSGGGWQGLLIWAIIGGVCGGLAAFYLEHSLTKNELKRLGERLPANSSAIAAFVRTADAQAILRLTAQYRPTTASVAAIGEHLSTRVWSGAENPTEIPSAQSRAENPDATTFASMLILRFKGQRAVRDVNARVLKEGTVLPELLFEVDKQGNKRVSAPTTGSAATARSGAPGWAVFGLVFGLVAGWSGDGGILSSLQDGLVTAIAWGIFGLGAGALYGLWSGRAISARRLKGVSPLLPPDTSAMIAWVDGAVTQQTINGVSTPDSESLALRFNPDGHGVVLEA